jgi:hypothetical protein
MGHDSNRKVEIDEDVVLVGLISRAHVRAHFTRCLIFARTSPHSPESPRAALVNPHPLRISCPVEAFGSNPAYAAQVCLGPPSSNRISIDDYHDLVSMAKKLTPTGSTLQ